MSRPNIFKPVQNNNNNTINKTNNRFSFVSEELKQDQIARDNSEPRQGNNLFLQRAKKTESIKPIALAIINNDFFPALGLSKKQHDKNVDDKNVDDKIPSTNNSYLKAIRHENVIIISEEVDKDEQRRKAVKPGWVSIFKNKSGKKELVYGPKTEEEKQKEFQESSMNYQMYLAISRMEKRWELEKQRYNAINGPNAYNERYGYVPTYDSDDDENDTTDSDDDYYTDYDSE
jgi:hypothetical protein